MLEALHTCAEERRRMQAGEEHSRSDAGKNIPGSDAASQEAERSQSADAGKSN